MQGARAVQKSVLRNFPDADISVSIVWIQMPGFNDNETTAKRMAGSFNDPRVKHYFDSFPAHLAGKESKKCFNANKKKYRFVALLSPTCTLGGLPRESW